MEGLDAGVPRRFDFELAGTPEEVGMATGATIHTRNGLRTRVSLRQLPAVGQPVKEASLPAPALVATSVS